jgi:hypothetical protein
MTEPTAAHKFSGTEVLTIFLSVSSAAVVVLVLLGYGVALSAEASFGIPHAVIFNSTTDLLTLGGWAVIQMVLILDKLSEWSFYVRIWGATWPATKIALGMMAALVALSGIAFAARYLLRRWTWLHRTVEQLRGSTRGKVVAVASYLVLVLATPLFVMPLAMLAALIGTVFLVSVLSMVPIAGLQVGKAYIDEWVVGPEICTPLTSRDLRLQAQPPVENGRPKMKVSTCVTVKKSSGTEYRGRVVFATFNSVVLYTPEAGLVRRVSTEDASIEVIDKL